MAKYSIYNADGSLKRDSAGNVVSLPPVFSGAYLKSGFLEFRNVSSPYPILWEVGDYVVYDRTGYKYSLHALPFQNIRKQAAPGSYGASFVYTGVQFYDETKKLEYCPFRDVVPDASPNTHYSSQSAVAVFDDVYGIAERIQANVDLIYPGQFTIEVIDTDDADLLKTLQTELDFSLDGGTCFDALSKIHELWNNIGWIYDEWTANGTLHRKITIGGADVRTAGNTAPNIAYGKGNGLVSIEQSFANRTEMATRLYVFGSNRNLINRYYNNVSEDIKDKESINIQNLMLPINAIPSMDYGGWGETTVEDPQGGPEDKKDAAKAYIENPEAIAAYGLIPKSVYFDGGEQDDIYPSLKEQTIGDLRAVMLPTDRYYPSSQYSADDRVDKPKAVTNPVDNGSAASDGSAFVDKYEVEPDTTGSGSIPYGENQEKEFVLTTFTFTPNVNGTGEVTLSPDIQGYITDQQFDYCYLKFTILASALYTRDVSSMFPLEVARGENRFYFDTRNDLTLKRPVAENDQLTIKMSVVFMGSQGGSTTYSIQGGALNVGLRYDLSKTFRMTIRQIGFDMNERAALGNGKATIAMTTGMCTGRSFVVKSCIYNSATDDWSLTLWRQSDKSVDMWYPNQIYNITTDDTFVLLDIAMPDTYVKIAERRLLKAGQDLLAKLSVPKPQFNPMVDAKVIAENGYILKPATYLHISDTDIDTYGNDYVLIDTVTINEGEKEIPTYRITLRDGKKITIHEGGGADSADRTTSVMDQSVSGYQNSDIAAVLEAYYTKDDINQLLGSYTPITDHNALVGRVGTVEGYFTSGNAKNALKLENHPASYFATASSVTSLTTRVTALEARKRFEDYFEIDQYGDIHVLYNRGFYSDSFVSAGGRSSTSGGGGSGLAVYTSSALGGTFSDTDDSVFNAYTVNALHGRIAALENSTPNVAWGTPGADYSPLTINGVTRNLLTTHQAIYPLTIKVAGTTRTIYNPSSAAANWNFVAGTGITLTGASGQVTIAIASGYATQTWVNTNFYTKTQVDNMVTAIPKFKVEVVQTLPAVGDSATVYLVPTQNDPQNLYTEYIYVDNAWEQLGTQGTDLTGYVNTLTNSGSGNYVTGITKSGNTLTVTYGTLPTTIALANVNDADDLKAIEALTGTTGLLKKTAANTWTLDTTAYLSSHQAVTLAPGTNNGTLKLTTAAGVVDNIAVKGLGTNAFSSEEYLPLTAGSSKELTGDLYTSKWITARPTVTETETHYQADFRINLRDPNNTSTYLFFGRAAKSKATNVMTYYTYLNQGFFTCQYTQTPAGTQGYRYFTVGSSVAKANANSGCGAIRLYGLTNADSERAYMVTLRPAVITSAKTIVIPDKAGTMALTTDNVASATVLATARNINGTAFDGSADITTALWGTARNITISDSDSTNTGTAVSVNGSANFNLLLPATIKATLSGNATSATALATARTLWGQSFDGSANVTGAMSDVTSIDSLLHFDTTNSRIGIGQSSPAYKLDVAGTFRATGNSQIGGALGVTGLATFGNNVRLSGHSLYFDSSHSKYAVYDTTVGGLHFNCGIYSDSWVSAGGVSTTSDINLKTDFVKVKLTVEDIAGAPAFDFAWKDGRGRSAGSIAQYWKKLLPNNVSTISGKYLAMEYGNIALLSAITIAKAVESQEAKIERLEKRVEELESQLLKQ